MIYCNFHAFKKLFSINENLPYIELFLQILSFQFRFFRFLAVIKNAFNFIYFAELTGGGNANVDCCAPEGPRL
jgi:hypothetical protein